MAILEQIREMKKQGIADEEIIRSLQEQGISPKEINDALNQSQIKEAISKQEGMEGMQQSIMDQGPPSNTEKIGAYTPQTQEMPEEELYAPQPEYPQSQDFSQDASYGEYAPGERFDSDIIIEISEQVFSEKIKKIQRKIEEVDEFKTLAETKIEDMSKRLRRIETTIDKLQIAILEKVGSYGRNLENIKKEMSMMQDSFGKMINPLVEKIEKKHAPKRSSHPRKKTASKKK